MLRRNLVSRAARTAKDNRNLELAGRHIKHFGRGVNDLIGGQDREIECHELDNRTQADHRRAYTQTGKTKFSDRRVNNPLGTVFLQESTRYLVRALIFRELFTREKHVL